jgi:phage shock protein C
MANSMLDKIKRRLTLDKKQGWIAGVCAGAANYFGTDPAFVRVGLIITALFLPKLTIAAYLIAWVLLDEGSSA